MLTAIAVALWCLVAVELARGAMWLRLRRLQRALSVTGTKGALSASITVPVGGWPPMSDAERRQLIASAIRKGTE